MAPLNGIDCLQVLQHADGSESYLTVRATHSKWAIGPHIDSDENLWIQSASAGGISPVQESNSRSEKSWFYSDHGGSWVEGIINVKCLTHN